jgi:hypothetical protein
MTRRKTGPGHAGRAPAAPRQSDPVPPEIGDPELRSAWIAAVRYFGFLPRGDGDAPPQAIDEDSASDQNLRRHVA